MRKTACILLALIWVSCKTTGLLLSFEELEKGNYQEVIGLFDESNSENPKPDKFPRYSGGLDGLLADVNAKTRYPEKERNQGVEGEVIVKYIIEKDGNIEEITIEKSISKGLDNEAIRVIKTLKKWFPGFKDGYPIRVEFRQSFLFKLK